MATHQKRNTMTGLGDGYFQKMKTEDTRTEAPVYEEETEIVPSLQQVQVEVTYEVSPLYLSNKKHSDLGRLSDVTITLNAAYLPEGFAEWASGATKIGPGAYAYNSNPTVKYFRFAFPATDREGNQVIFNFPKCQLQPVGVTAQTETENQEAQISDFNIVGNALVYRSEANAEGENNIYLKVDTTTEEGKGVYDTDVLLEQGWYDQATLEAAKLSEGDSDPEV